MINKDLVYTIILIVFAISVFITGFLVGAMYQDQYSVTTVNIHGEFIDTYNITHANTSTSNSGYYNRTD